MSLIRTLVIKQKPVSWNAVIGKVHWSRYKLFKEWEKATWAAVAEARPRFLPIPEAWCPLKLTFTARWKGKRRHDIDSLLVKPVVDALVSLKLIPDDNLDYIGSVSFEGHIEAVEGADTLEVRIEPERKTAL